MKRILLGSTMLALAVASMALAVESPMLVEYDCGVTAVVQHCIDWPQHVRSSISLLTNGGSAETSSRTNKARVWAGGSL